jgi:hypothetical protein
MLNWRLLLLAAILAAILAGGTAYFSNVAENPASVVKCGAAACAATP